MCTSPQPAIQPAMVADACMGRRFDDNLLTSVSETWIPGLGGKMFKVEWQRERRPPTPCTEAAAAQVGFLTHPHYKLQ